MSRSTSDLRFAQVPEDVILDPKLSAKARGVYVTLAALDLTRPTTVAKIADRFPDGEAAIKSGLTELESIGYLTREVQRAEGGRLAGVIYTLHATPRDPATRRTA